MTTVHYTAKVKAARLLELPEEASELGLKPGDEVQVCVDRNGTAQPFYETATPQEWEEALRAWAASHVSTPPLSDEAIDRESIYEGRGE